MSKALEKKIIATVRKAVAESVHDALTDPDYRLELTPAVRSKLTNYRRKKKHQLTSLSEVRRRFS